MLIAGLGDAAGRGVGADPRIPADLADRVGVAISQGLDFVPLGQVQAALTAAGVPPDQAAAGVEAYAEAQLQALRAGLLAAAAIALASLFVTNALPSMPAERERREPTPA